MEKDKIKEYLGKPAQEKIKKNLLLDKDTTEEAERILKAHGKSLSGYVILCLEDLISESK